jgi:hypothetical protein
VREPQSPVYGQYDVLYCNHSKDKKIQKGFEVIIMFDDARFYSKLAEDSRSYGYVSSSDCSTRYTFKPQDSDDDLLSAMDRAEEYLI